MEKGKRNTTKGKSLETETTFTTLDLYLAAFLTFSGTQPRLDLRNRRVIFAAALRGLIRRWDKRR